MKYNNYESKYYLPAVKCEVGIYQLFLGMATPFLSTYNLCVTSDLFTFVLMGKYTFYSTNAITYFVNYL